MLVSWCGAFKTVNHCSSCFDLSYMFLHKFVLCDLVFCHFLDYLFLSVSLAFGGGIVEGFSLQDAHFFGVVVGVPIDVVVFLDVFVSVSVVIELECDVAVLVVYAFCQVVPVRFVDERN